MPKLINLIGKEFDSWKVLQKLPSKKGKTYWLCKCILCGAEKEIQGTNLRNGSYGRCKCCIQKTDLSKKESNIEKRICLICGKEFQPQYMAYSRKYCYQCSPVGLDKQANITSIRHAIKHQLVLYKGGKCQECGYSKCEGALQFHHLDPNEKDFNLSNKYNNGCFDMDKLKLEVDKCVLLCANCHAEKHFKQ